MIDFQRLLQQEFETVTPEAYYEINRSPTVVYPYLTYTHGTEDITGNQEGFYITVNLFHYGPSIGPLLDLEERLRSHFHKQRLFTPEVFMQVTLIGADTVPTNEEQLRRRDVRLFCKIDWRKKEWQ